MPAKLTLEFTHCDFLLWFGFVDGENPPLEPTALPTNSSGSSSGSKTLQWKKRKQNKKRKTMKSQDCWILFFLFFSSNFARFAHSPVRSVAYRRLFMRFPFVCLSFPFRAGCFLSHPNGTKKRLNEFRVFYLYSVFKTLIFFRFLFPIHVIPMA